MGHKVAVSVVPKNPLMVSVEFTDTDTGFLLSVEEDFVNELTQEELEAAIAHELGHVWIFTHHPFLQTECWRTKSRSAWSRAPAWCRSTKRCGIARAPRATSPASSATDQAR